MRIYELAQTGVDQLRSMIANLLFGRGSLVVKAVIISGFCAMGIMLIEALVRDYKNLKTELATARSELATGMQRIITTRNMGRRDRLGTCPIAWWSSTWCRGGFEVANRGARCAT